ncbi:MAG TPA: hypothetical protein VL125_10010 [Pelobium sp.]|nr:hypothetical protein [Pelobium sp.]
MTTFIINKYRLRSLLPVFNMHPVLLLLLTGMLINQSLPLWIYRLDPTAALPDAGVWSLILLSILVFLILLLLNAYLFSDILKRLGLQGINSMVSQFKTLTLWQQYVFYWASFALLLLAAIGCLMAIC